MSSVLFLAHRSRARVNARVLARRKRDETRKMAGREGEEAGVRNFDASEAAVRGWRVERRKRREEARKANREDVLHAKEHMLGGRAKGGMRLHRRNALGRTGQDGPRENEDEISDGGCKMDGRGKRVRICLPFSAGGTASSYRFGTVVRILTLVSCAELFQGKF